MTNKDIWRKRWLSCINKLTSLDLQRKSWLDKTNTNPHWTFVEFMCTYFDDLAIDNSYKYQLEKEWVLKQEFEIIKEWHEELDKFHSPQNDDYDHEAILNDPKWLEIVQMGVNARNKLAKTLSERERQFLTDEIDYFNRFHED